MAYVAASSKGLRPVHPSIAKLVDLLKSEDEATLVKALKSIHNISRQDRNRNHIMECGAYGHIIDLASNSSELVKEQTGYALIPLAEGEAFTNFIGEVGGIEAMLKLISTSTRAETIINAAKALTKLCATVDNRALFRQSGGLEVVAAGLKHDNDWIKQQSAATLIAAYADDAFARDSYLIEQNLADTFNHFKSHIESSSSS